MKKIKAKLNSKKYEIIFIIISLAVGLFFSTYKLTESPPIWFDEGNYIQTAINLANYGQQAIQTAPGELISTNHLTAGYPLLYPLSLSFKYFGVGLFQARIIMAIFIAALILVSYLLVKKLFGFRMAVFASLLLVTFPPIYGHGKNVMGEVPGLFFLILFLFFLYKIENNNFQKVKYYIYAGLSAGLCIATKPIFIILLPALVITILFYIKKINWNWKIVLAFLLSLAAPIVIWIKWQFQGKDFLTKIISYYANPHGLDSSMEMIINNILRFFTEGTPIYLMIMLICWTIAILIRANNKRNISLAEKFSFTFCLILLAAYLKTIGFYRYFLPVNILALIFFPASFYVCIKFLRNRWSVFNKIKFRYLFFLPIIILVAFNFYMLCFNSWVAEHYNSKKSEKLSNYFNSHNQNKSIFLYNTPELAVFLSSDIYYQYIELTPTQSLGNEQLDKIQSGIPDEIIIPAKTYNKIITNDKINYFTLYNIKEKISEYTVLERVAGHNVNN